MQVLVDSNQFIADFLLQNAPFRYLLHFLNNEGHTLLLSRLVIEEVENKYVTETQKALADASKSHQRLEQLGLPLGPERPPGLAVPPLNLEKRIRAQLNSVEILEYQDVPHAMVVQRALKRRKPFDADGAAGYRDCLLWLSLARRLASDTVKSDEDVIFISSNWKDFYQAAPAKEATNAGLEKAPSGPDINGKKTPPILTVQFHDDLVADLDAVKRSVVPFYTVAAFVDSKVDKKKHVVNFDKHSELFEEYLEEQGLAVLQQLGHEHGSYVLQHLFPLSTASALTLLNSDAEIWEGLEDLDIYLAEEVGNAVYVSCGFDLRIVNVDLFVPRSQFETRRAEIEAAIHVWEVSEFEDKVAIRVSLRAYYQASFSFDPRTQDCSGFSLQTFAIR